MSAPIPQPPGYPILGNIDTVDPSNAMLSLVHLAEKYGEIFKLTVFGKERYFVSSVRLLNELCDETRFCKAVGGPLEQLRNGLHDGLFTAHYGEHAWGVAHRALVPAFGPIGIQHMFDEMYDIATQLVAKWARNGPDESIDVTSDFTRLTLDSIALCAMDCRFNSFYSEDLHPFVGAMVGFLDDSGKRTRRTRIENFLHPEYQRQYDQNIETLRSVAANLVARRRSNPTDKKDLLNAMLFGKDPKTGERLSESSIIDNMITFLIAGHETTSGMLSFTTCLLLKNPETLRKAQDEVDRVIGKRPITYKDISKLPYIEACMRESLRMWPTAPGFTIKSLPGETGSIILGGQYAVPSGAPIFCVLPAIGRDHEVFGSDADQFIPKRMQAESFEKLPSNAWKPFGNGVRGCIGRPFAWQEAVLALAIILQNFNLRLDDPAYELKISQTLTIKPAGLRIKAALREGIDPITLQKKLYSTERPESTKETQNERRTHAPKATKPMTILYGSNSGTCEGLAQSLAKSASAHGYLAKVQPLDSAIDQVPKKQPVVIITASYEGQPPDNATQFVPWLTSEAPEKFKEVQYAVFGCGHHDWVATYQRIPILIDKTLSNHGAKQIVARGETDVAKGNIFDDFDEWQDNLLWPKLFEGVKVDVVNTNDLDIEINTAVRSSHLKHTVQDALVLKNELLTSPGVPEKRHVEIRLPTNASYQAGDYLAVLPINPIEVIGRVLRRFNLPWDAMMVIRKGSHTAIPIDTPLSVTAVLGAYVELNSPPSRKNLATIAQYAIEGTFTHQHPDLSPSATHAPSVLEVLEANPKLQLPFSVYLSMLTPMRIRQYSISSSPLADPTAVAAGTGLAPFRGFVQERAAKIAAAKSTNRETGLAEAVLFVGCRCPEEDLLYHDLLNEWEKLGAVKVFPAFSRKRELSAGCKYAQDRLYAEKELVSRLFEAGGRAYICGSAKLGEGVADTAAKIIVENCAKKSQVLSHEQALQYWQGLRGERFAVDVFD